MCFSEFVGFDFNPLHTQYFFGGYILYDRVFSLAFLNMLDHFNVKQVIESSSIEVTLSEERIVLSICSHTCTAFNYREDAGRYLAASASL